jgi:hypothetical protein
MMLELYMSSIKIRKYKYYVHAGKGIRTVVSTRLPQHDKTITNATQNLQVECTMW